MKQVLQSRKKGKAAVEEVPLPALQRGRVLVRTIASLISAGTERAVVETARKGLLQEARERPDLVRSVVEKALAEGFSNTISSVRNKLASSQALGYSAAGTVIQLGDEVNEFRIGDSVACAGVGFASHAEVISVPKNLCVKLPETVDFEAGAFGTLGAIALQGVRLAEPSLGESVVVVGLGLVGQLAVQLLHANGCRVFGIDLDPTRVALAKRLGADAGCISDEEAKNKVSNWTRSRGADAVLITAATDSNQPLELAGEISRLKGRVVVVGMIGLNVPRQTFYTRELALKISMSYGPGRYDPHYEERGHDYPFAYVRWTEQRNIEAFLDLLAAGRVSVAPLITHRFPVEEAEQAYKLISGDLNESHLGVLLRYNSESTVVQKIELREQAKATPQKSIRLGVIGAGRYVSSMLLPQFRAAGADFRSLMTASGVTAYDAGKKFGFAAAVSEADAIINDDQINLVVVGTRHDLHAQLSRQALERNRHVFVEKPLAVNDEELDELLRVARLSSGRLMVGFNRRFSPLARKAKEFFAGRSAPLSILYRVNAGRAPREHWAYEATQGGGRIVGEVCHFVDLMQYWIGAPPVSVYCNSISAGRHEIVNDESVFVSMEFADGSNGCIAYLAEGERTLAKERVEIFGEGKVFVLDDFQHATLYANGRAQEVSLKKQDKGQAEQVRAVCAVVLEGLPAPITLEDLAATTRATFRMNDSLRTGQSVRLDEN